MTTEARVDLEDNGVREEAIANLQPEKFEEEKENETGWRNYGRRIYTRYTDSNVHRFSVLILKGIRW